jgi:hypothetical protein
VETTMRRAALLLALLSALTLPAAAQPSRMAEQFPSAAWNFYGGASIGKACTPCRWSVPIDKSARPWGPTGISLHAYDAALYIQRYAGTSENYSCLKANGCGAQCDYTHQHVGVLKAEEAAAAAIGVPRDLWTSEEQLDFAYSNPCPAPSDGGSARGSMCAAALPYHRTPRVALRCHYFELNGRCHEWLGAPASAPACCPGTEALGCPPGGVVKPPPPPPEMPCDGGAPDTFCTPREEAAGTCPEDCKPLPPVGPTVYRLALRDGGELSVEVLANGLLRQVEP